MLCGIERASDKTAISAPQREDMVARIERRLYDLSTRGNTENFLGNSVLRLQENGLLKPLLVF